MAVLCLWRGKGKGSAGNKGYRPHFCTECISPGPSLRQCLPVSPWCPLCMAEWTLVLKASRSFTAKIRSLKEFLQEASATAAASVSLSHLRSGCPAFSPLPTLCRCRVLSCISPSYMACSSRSQAIFPCCCSLFPLQL
uniref:Uncharacterized protein n=1 Tax=Rousettus aegyptiacus TaxID=9407 RepID=A0A7J8KB12_ROUAE|nr:hypothetical protein HJG63_007901 [Rousettus aegyptiacus]